ncbi:hemerythrin domain-containing protein [Chromobacterium sp. IIBBL 290-4]|uniref:hemerythrin domain-containing protein n=1 Tax=Chromobacterium sp. IIBBL 290-4 TaxID=2953890 RepID=UPI0020B70AEB|nr:hemerythrin domain-containing protein [Chromobacterium sp. IIBBL 290-4]UTH73768.1 hemerythrin domain-containing protein [Chromobacterium sp. IIBBL 290-4]
MMQAAETLIQQHRDCDARFADAEQAARKQDWPAAAGAFAALRQEMEGHFELEERRLFPAFEEASGIRSGPTAVMRAEHEQMKALLADMAQALAARDGAGFLGVADTLLILAQQHNMKEENILYPMCEQMIAGLQSWPEWRVCHAH